MSEPEEVITEAAHLATVAARALWAARRGPDARVHLAHVHRRLELLTAALFPGAPAIGVAEPPPPLPLLARLASPLAARARPGTTLASTDGSRIRLPAVLDAVPDAAAGIARYRLLALEQGARAARGTPAATPVGDALERDLYLLAEAVAVDRALASLVPGLGDDLAAARRLALAEREAGRERLAPRERAVGDLVRAVLRADPGAPDAAVPPGATPDESRRWAAAAARRIRALPGRYRGVAPVALWGAVAPPPDAPATAGASPPAAGPPHAARTHTMRRRPRARASREDEDDARMGTWIVRADDPQQSVEDPMGLQRPVDREEDADPGDLGDSLADLREARLVRTPERPREVLASADPLPRAPAAPEPSAARTAIAYPEWDWRERRYRTPGALVREPVPRAGDPAWARALLERHGALVRRVRRDFERLRPRREIRRRQLDGTDIDVDAWVTARADAHAGAEPDPRLYLADRRARRDAAVLILVDVSASTDAWVADTRRVVDVEREALVIAAEALAALGDPHAMYAFRGEGARRVDLLPLKRFGEPPGAAVRARIAALEPDGYTRVGAAVRHATAVLARQPARRRLLLLLSDGRPNDVDAYEGRYGLEDTRQAIIEARAQDVHPYCVTVDREAPVYASRVFGEGGYAVLPRADRLPAVLVRVVRGLVRG